MKGITVISDVRSLVWPPAKINDCLHKATMKSWASGQTWRSPWGRGPRIPATAFWPHVWWSAEGLWKMNSSLHWSNPFSGFFCFHLTFTTFWHLDWCNGAHCFCARNFVENHKMFSAKYWVFSLAFHHQYWISVDSDALCVSGSLRYNDSSEVFLLLLLPTATERQRKNSVHRKNVCLCPSRQGDSRGQFQGDWQYSSYVWREKLHGNSLTTPPFIFSGGVYRWRDAVKKVGRDFSGGVFVDFSSLPFWLLKGCRDQLLLTFNGPWKKCSSLSPWVVYQFLGSRVTFYFFDVCYLTLSGPIGVVSIFWMQVAGAEVDATYAHNVMMNCSDF